MNEEQKKIREKKIQRITRVEKKKINKKKLCLVLVCIIAIIWIGMFIGKTLSRYQSQGSSQADVDVAFWIVSDTIQEQTIALEGLAPGETKECTISVSNNNGTIRTNAAIEYKIIIDTTTNLPLTYEIYEKTNTGETLCEKESERLYQDEDGTYYKEITVNGFELGCNEDETTTLAIKATFPAANNNIKLADLIECVNIKIDAQQKISE